MLVATFGSSTGWQGREIIWDVDHFVLVGHGAVAAAGVLDYDRRGQLIWAYPELRAWVAQVERWERGGTSTPPGGGMPAATAGPGTQRSRAGVPVWAIVVAAVVVGALILVVGGAALVSVLVTHSTQSLADDMMVRIGAQTIQAGIESYAGEHGGRLPAPGEVNAVSLGRYISAWPRNPYTDLPMADGGGEGNFRYDVSADGGAYRLIGYGRDGETVIQLSGGTQSTV
jgi:hypothetical protein